MACICLNRRQLKSHRLLLLSAALQLAQVLVLGLLCPSMGQNPIPGTAILLSVVLQLGQAFVVVCGLVRTIRAVVAQDVVIGKVWQMYICMVLGFQGVYMLLYLFYCSDPSISAFDAPDDVGFSSMNYAEISMLIGGLYAVVIISQVETLYVDVPELTVEDLMPSLEELLSAATSRLSGIQQLGAHAGVAPWSRSRSRSVSRSHQRGASLSVELGAYGLREGAVRQRTLSAPLLHYPEGDYSDSEGSGAVVGRVSFRGPAGSGSSCSDDSSGSDSGSGSGSDDDGGGGCGAASPPRRRRRRMARSVLAARDTSMPTPSASKPVSASLRGRAVTRARPVTSGVAARLQRSRRRRTRQCRRSCARSWHAFWRWPPVRMARRVTRRHLLLVTLALQALNLLVCWRLEPVEFAQYGHQRGGAGVASWSSCLQTLQVVAIVATSLKFIQQKHSHTATLRFLLQSYVSVTLAFPGIYFATMVYADRSSFHLTAVEEDATWYRVLWKLVYFSVTTMTTTGFGDVYPIEWYSRLAVLCQVNLAVLYSAVVFGMGLNSLKPEDKELLDASAAAAVNAYAAADHERSSETGAAPSLAVLGVETGRTKAEVAASTATKETKQHSADLPL